MNVYARIICLAAATAVACSESDLPQAFDCTTSSLTLSLEGVQDASACDATDGSITVTASGGAEPYAYSLAGLEQQGGTFGDLSPGIYTVTVVDANGCAFSVTNVTVPAKGFTITTDLTPDTSCLEGTGGVTIHVADGMPPYQYRLSDGLYGSTNTFTGLRRGPHAVSVKDDAGCEVHLHITIPQGITGVSWKDDVLPIVKTNCALNGCHDGLVRPDLSRYDKAKFYADEMKELTQDGSMPFEGSISREQVDLIACWVDDGAADN